MSMQSIAWWPSVAVLITAAIIDLSTRRIPNWLSLPFLVAGMAVQSVHAGRQGFIDSLAGIGLALLLFGLPCCIRLMGMGDLKLAIGVGAWIGATQFFFAFIVAAMVAGIMAALYALRHQASGTKTGRFRFGGLDVLGSPGAQSIPYAPALAIGTLFSFFAH